MAAFSLPNTSAVILLIIVSCFHINNAQLSNTDDLHFQGQDCYKERGTFSVLTNFSVNRDAALARLATLASTSYFNTTTVGSGQSQVNALFSCRYDVTPDVCQACVKEAANKVSPFCFFNVEAFIAFEECRVHYGNRTFFGTQEDLPRLSVFSIRNVTDNAEFSPVLGTLVTGLINDAIVSFDKSSRYFATEKGSFDSQTLSALAQCNPDITTVECRTCLRNAFGNFTLAQNAGPVLGQIYTPSCLLTYKLSSFSGSSVPDEFPSPVPETPSSTPPSGDDVPEAPSTFPSSADNVPESPSSFPSSTGGNMPRAPAGFPLSGASRSLMYGSIVASIFVAILPWVLLV